MQAENRVTHHMGGKYLKMMLKIPAKLNRKIGQAMHDYSMFEDGDRILVAVSGGIDSLVLAVILYLWQVKVPIQMTLQPLHIDHGFWRHSEPGLPPSETIGRQIERFATDLKIERERKLEESERTCYLCARNRRSQLFDYARDHGYTKLALGHHKDDLIETFMLNAIFSGNISTMLPKQVLFSGSLSIVRPMAFLEKHEVAALADRWKLNPVKNLCPLSGDTKREKVRSILSEIYKAEPDSKNSLFAALSNVRKEYLL